MPNGQNILVKCEVKSRGGDVFDMIVAHSNLIEHFYFGLAYIDGKGVDEMPPFTNGKDMHYLSRSFCSVLR